MNKAIVIGATSGIGKELARLLVKNGFYVGITGRRENLLDELKSENPDMFFTCAFDLTKTETISQNLDNLVRILGGTDLVIISSGTGDINRDLEFKTEKSTIDVNVTGFTAAAVWAFNYFIRQKQGHLVAITSIAGLRGNREAPSYNATKSYQINYLEGLRQKGQKTGLPIYITDIRPGFVNTNMAKGDGLFWVASPEKAALRIFSAIKSKKSVQYVTRRWGLIAGLLKVIPRSLFRRL